MEKFPTIVYRDGGDEDVCGAKLATRHVGDEAELAAALGEGWRETPEAPETGAAKSPPVTVSTETVAVLSTGAGGLMGGLTVDEQAAAVDAVASPPVPVVELAQAVAEVAKPVDPATAPIADSEVVSPPVDPTPPVVATETVPAAPRRGRPPKAAATETAPTA